MPISLEEHPEMENNCENTSVSKTGKDFKATELRLGLPGCESPERDNGYSSLKGFVSGAKRGFADTINGGNGSGKWGLSVKVGSEIGFSKNGGLFSPRGVNVNISDGNTVNAVTESPKPSLQVQEKETPQVSAINGPAKAQVIGWPPIRSFRKNSMANNPSKSDETNGLYVKVSMDGAPYLRKIDLKTYNSYKDLSSALEKMFSCFTIGQVNENGIKDLICGSEFVLTYEDKDNDWMLVGDVPWEMFMNTCNRLRIMKSSDAIGLAPRVTEKCKSHN